MDLGFKTKVWAGLVPSQAPGEDLFPCPFLHPLAGGPATHHLSSLCVLCHITALTLTLLSPPYKDSGIISSSPK